MGYHLFQSNRMDGFLEGNTDRFIRKDLFGPPLWFVVQNRNMADWLKLRLTDIRGITAGFTSLYPEQAIRQFAEYFEHPWRADGEEPRTVLFMDNLKIVLYKKLEEIKKRRDRRYALLLEFLDDDSRLFDIANVLAGLFYRYGMNCFDLVAAWEEGRSIGLGGSAREQESWQRLLWNELFGPQGDYILLSRILVHIREEELPYGGPEGRIVLFGSSFLGDAGLNFFSYLSRFLEVEHFLLTPSRVFLADRSEPVREEWESLTTLIQGVAGFFQEKPPRDLELVIREKDDYPSTLLGALQKSLWRNEFDEAGEAEGDDSLRFFSCTGPWRQVEEAKNAILSLLEADEDLKLTDIALMAPDINEFAPYIEALFQEEPLSLPYNFIDLKNQSQSAFTDGFLSLLELPAGRFSRKEMFALFRNPCFAQAFRITESEEKEWDQVCRETGILWGMDGKHLAKLDLPPRENNRWERGFDRLLDGMVYADPEEKENLPCVFPDESRNISLGKLIFIVRSLYEDFFPLSRQKMPLESWIPRVEQLMEKYLHGRPDNEGDSRDRERIKAVFRNINNVMEGLDYLNRLNDPAMPWSVCRSLIVELMGKTGLRKGGYLTRGISCSSLKPLRAVPFRVVLLLGMDYAVFPGKDEEFSFDLTDLARPQVDLSRRGGDRFSFLEAFLSARDKFWIFYTGRSHISGEAMHPSQVVTELEDMVERHYPNYLKPGNSLLVQTPLQPYDDTCFDGSRQIPSYDGTAYEQAVALRTGGGHKTGGEGRLSLAGEESPEEIDLIDLIGFYRNPLRQYARKSLRIFHREEADREEETLDPVEPALFEDLSFHRELIELWCRHGALDLNSLEGMAEQWWEKEVIRGHLAGSRWDRPSYLRLWEKGKGLLSELNRYESSLWEGGEARERNFQVAPAGADSGQTVYLKAPEALWEGHVLRLTGDTGPLYGREALGSVQFCFGKKEHTKDLFPAFLSHLCLAQGAEENYYGRQLLVAGEKYSRLIGWTSRPEQRGEHFIPVPEPNRVLNNLVDLYRENLNNPLPFYPSLIDDAAEMIEKGKLDRADLPREWPYLWKRALARDRGNFDIKNCPYREMLMDEAPSWDRRLDRLFDEILPWLL
ncbi:MAG: exodeoxyribonuclease V subunit gamma [Spirochaetales bacterium]|nr:exodeoxyribonuclease V subunit gamma [Spirochaetales bacterium]